MNKEYPTWPGWDTVRLIGRGSFGAVYEIERDLFEEKESAALKVISIPQNESDIEEMYSDGYDEESITSTFQGHLKSIVAEYSLMRKMNGCTNIVNCDDVRYVHHDDGIGWDIFIKMELLTPLIRAIPSNVSEETVLKIGHDICAALATCQEFGIIHRDIKPQNIFVSRFGDYKLGDFGIAKTVEKTMGGTKIGTYKYMAPEVYNNKPYGGSADIYSLGLVLYWLLNERRLPFLPLPPVRLTSELEENARLWRFRGDEIPAPAHGCDEFKRIVLKACAFDPANRFASAREMLAAINALNVVNGGAAFSDAVVAGREEHSADEQNSGNAYELEDSETIGVYSEQRDSNNEGDESTTVVSDNLGVDSTDIDGEDATIGVWKSTQTEQDKHKTANHEIKKKGKGGLAAGVVAAVVLIVLVISLSKGTTNNQKNIILDENNSVNSNEINTIENVVVNTTISEFSSEYIGLTQQEAKDQIGHWSVYMMRYGLKYGTYEINGDFFVKKVEYSNDDFPVVELTSLAPPTGAYKLKQEFDNEEKLVKETYYDVDEVPLETITYDYEPLATGMKITEKHYSGCSNIITDWWECIFRSDSWKINTFDDNDLWMLQTHYSISGAVMGRYIWSERTWINLNEQIPY